jgi:fructose 1,6-bisphosphate aldolase/phosphatase
LRLCAEEGPVSFFDGPPVVSCVAYCVHEGRLTRPVDAFDHPFWDYIRDRISQKAVEIRRQGFFGLKYGGIVQKLEVLENRFQVRN